MISVDVINGGEKGNASLSVRFLIDYSLGRFIGQWVYTVLTPEKSTSLGYWKGSSRIFVLYFSLQFWNRIPSIFVVILFVITLIIFAPCVLCSTCIFQAISWQKHFIVYNLS